MLGLLDDALGRDDMVGLDSSIILPKQTWEASGHVDTFSDPLTECQSCHRRFRADHLIEGYAAKHGKEPEHGLALHEQDVLLRPHRAEGRRAREVHDLLGDATVLDLAVRGFNKTILIDS